MTKYSPLPLKFTNYELRITNVGSSTPSSLERVGVRSLWHTANEINVSHFNIQRSINGKDFITIGKVAAKNKNFNEYSFIDEPTRNEQQETWFYRIESIDFDGKKQYSEIRNVDLGIRNLGLSIFPNPAKDFITIECKGAKELFIIDYLGRLMKQLNNVSEHQTINTKQLPKGLYVVKIITINGITEIAKFVKE